MQYKKAISYLTLYTGLILATVGCNDDSTPREDEKTSPNPELVRSDAFPGVVCEELTIPLRDGILTSAFAYRLDKEANEEYPTIIVRTPYARINQGKGCFVEGDSTLADGIAYARASYSYVIQHVRGTYTSDGNYNAVSQEKNDGYDSIEWVAAQPWSNGNIGIRGASYLGMTAWQAAISAPPSLKAASISVSPENYYREAFYNQGIPHHSLNISWPEVTSINDQIIRKETDNGTAQEVIDQLIIDRQGLSFSKMWNDWVWQLPLTSFNQFDGLNNSLQTWLEHPVYDDFWQKIDIGESISQVNYPVLIHGAWYDLFSEGSFASFESMRSHSSSIEARDNTKLIISQYGHATNQGTPSFGNYAFGFTADIVNSAIQGDAFRPYDMNYFDYYLKESDNGYNEEPTIKLAIMVPPDSGQQGSNFVLDTAEYPLKNTEYKSFYLHSNGDANDRNGSGELSASIDLRDASIGENISVKVAGFSADLFSYDPLNPVPTLGGNLCCGTGAAGGPKSGAVEQAEVEVRKDVLVYTSEPLIEPLVVIGPVTVELFAKSSAVDTDFMAKLVDIRPDGSSHNILDGAVRARLRKGLSSQQSLIEPNKTYTYSINLGHTGTVFPVGHRIRLQVSSSNFPKFARNLNTGNSNETTSETMVANQVILHDAINASRLILPIVSGIDIPE